MNQRRLRENEWIRDLVREVVVRPEALVQPHFVVQGLGGPEAVPGLTGVFRENEESLLKRVESDLENSGVRKLLLFGVPNEKANGNFKVDFTARQVERLRAAFGKNLFIAVDVCFCSYSTHGHCGVLHAECDHLENAATVSELAKASLVYAQAGADCVAPSDMMDGRVAAIRKMLDENGFSRRLLMSYSAKFHSSFYGPFRVAADSSPQKSGQKNLLHDRSTYQIDPSHPRDAYLSSERDAKEGADILMVKPALAYLDILQDLSRRIEKPWAVYEVSGEYAAIEVLAERGLIDARRAHLESWTAFFRAGASMVITYGARHARKWLSES